MKYCLMILLFLPLMAVSQLRVARIFTDNMVIQREQPVHIWGKDIPGRQVSISFANEIKSATVQADSSWNVYFSKQKASAAARSIVVISGSEKITFTNVVIGDVWICSGQSNMEFPMSREMHVKEEMQEADQPLIRLYNPSPAGRYVYGVPYSDSLNRRLNPADFYGEAKWQTCDSNTVKPMTAIGYYFAKAIVAREHIPIGLINVSIGGAPIETFIRREALQNHQQFSVKVKGNWLENESLPTWIRERGKQNVGSNLHGFGDDLGLNHAYKPGFAYASGIAPITATPIKGVLWYQGESNSLEKARVEEYRDLLHLMIDDYRSQWKQSELPFYWVQLSSIDTANYQSQCWPQFRDEQRKLLREVKHGGMAVCSDIGFKNDVHPTNKKAVGQRLARWALNKTYGNDIVPSGPLVTTAKFIDGIIVISFEYTAKGLKTSDGAALRGFSIDGKTETAAVVRGNKIVIPVKEKPAFVYYGWKPFTDANLVNSEGLPASTFRVEVR